VALIDTLKDYLDITWDDSHTDAKLGGILARAQDKLCAYAGSDSVDFGDGTTEQQLLLDLCRYTYNNASEDFEQNYKADLLMLRAKYATIDPEEVADDETDEGSESENISGSG
jgi:hypothetical protein